VLFQVRVPGAIDGATADRVGHVATVLARHMVRDSDVVADLGCGHFGVVANATGEGARTLAGLLARELCAFDYTDHGRRVEIVLASGVASLENGKTPRDLLEEARAALEPDGSRALPSYC
jgi:PleD family two-component response regulator